jgi:glyoxylase-like metal-dependent hydrolase (beta-lactamase superfamily II)
MQRPPTGATLADLVLGPARKRLTAPPSRRRWTSISGARDAVLMDARMTVREASAVADWVALHERRLTTIYSTHGHGDHSLGLSVLLDRWGVMPESALSAGLASSRYL